MTFVAADEIDRLTAEVAELRRQLAELRDALAAEVRTGRVVVADDAGRSVEIEPGWVLVDHRASGHTVCMMATDWGANLDVMTGDTIPGHGGDRRRSVSLKAASQGDEEGHDDPVAYLAIDDCEWTTPWHPGSPPASLAAPR